MTWGDRAPRRAVASLQVYVSHLRKLLAVPERPESPIVTRSPGYSLILGDDALDLREFQELLGTGRSEAGAQRHEHAVVAFGAALSLCRGPALHGLEHIPAARAFTTWYEESRLECTELLVESKLALGQHRDLVGDLYTLTSEHPLREVFHRQLMLALYRSGRQADALAVYRSLGDHLGRDLGLEPGRASRDLQKALTARTGAGPHGAVHARFGQPHRPRVGVGRRRRDRSPPCDRPFGREKGLDCVSGGAGHCGCLSVCVFRGTRMAGLLFDNTGLAWNRLNRARLPPARGRCSSHFVITDGSWPGFGG